MNMHKNLYCGRVLLITLCGALNAAQYDHVSYDDISKVLHTAVSTSRKVQSGCLFQNYKPTDLILYAQGTPLADIIQNLTASEDKKLSKLSTYVHSQEVSQVLGFSGMLTERYGSQGSGGKLARILTQNTHSSYLPYMLVGGASLLGGYKTSDSVLYTVGITGVVAGALKWKLNHDQLNKNIHDASSLLLKDLPAPIKDQIKQAPHTDQTYESLASFLTSSISQDNQSKRFIPTSNLQWHTAVNTTLKVGAAGLYAYGVYKSFKTDNTNFVHSLFSPLSFLAKKYITILWPANPQGCVTNFITCVGSEIGFFTAHNAEKQFKAVQETSKRYLQESLRNAQLHISYQDVVEKRNSAIEKLKSENEQLKAALNLKQEKYHQDITEALALFERYQKNSQELTRALAKLDGIPSSAQASPAKSSGAAARTENDSSVNSFQSCEEGEGH